MLRPFLFGIIPRMTQTKKCFKCGNIKPLEDYYKHPATRDGRLNKCKSCTKKDASSYGKSEAGKETARRARSKPEAKARHRAYCKEWERNKKDSDPQYLLRKVLRSRVSNQLNRLGGIKAGSAVRDLGCTVEELMVHLEKQFQPGMTWENRGEWHIDHIKPLASFDLTDEVQFKEACNYTNLQPLWAKDNLSKGKN